ncbi:MAG: TonB-dependent receptor [Crocinitomicaceae bacterium]|nr:TonB-dependent receptor [Crocinitomicaceae bacterium]
MNLKIALITLVSCLSLYTFSQNTSISGVVYEENGETFPAVLIFLNNETKPLRTDFDGQFNISEIQQEHITLTFRYAGYKSKVLEKILLTKGQNNIISVNMELDVKVIDEIFISATLDKGSSIALIKERQNSASVSDGISSTEMKSRPDNKASDVLKRISGASIQENRFIIIRGLNDRYNSAFINGAPLPSSESDRKAFSYDIFPAVMLDQILIKKTATPDMPGEFAGGVIYINTVQPKDSNFQTISIGSSFNTLSTFKKFSTYQGGKTDWLGFDDGTRALSKEIPNTKTFHSLNNTDRANLATQITPSWAIKNRLALPNLNLQYALGRNIALGKRKLGIAFAYTYQNNFATEQKIRREFEEQASGVLEKSRLTDRIYTQKVLNSGMLNLNYDINSGNQISFKNLYSMHSEDQVNIRKGIREMDNDPHIFEKSSNRSFTQNQLYTSQLEGNHQLKKSKIKFNWNLGMSNVNRTVPNMRRVVYQKTALEETDPAEPYIAVIQNNGTIPTAAGNMFWSKTNEGIYSAKYDLIIPVKTTLKTEKPPLEIKIGGMHQLRSRDFSARNLGFSKYKANGIDFDNELLLLPEDQIFHAANLGIMSNGKGGFKLEEATKVSDNYQASSMLHAAYWMFDYNWKQKLRFVGGVRMESYNQKFAYTEAGTNIDKKIDTTGIDLLPSLNIIYGLNKKTNLRLSYYKTLSRPEFRELAPFAFYNFAMDNILSGNTNLKRALIDNVDLRYETFLKDGQLFSISGFYKYFKNPIELVNRTGTSGASELYYTNVDKVSNYGIELEYRIKLSTFKKSKTDQLFLNNTTLYTNFASIKSKVDVRKINGAVGDSRPLQGQSPYLINAGLQFIHPRKDFSVNISYNVVGRRIFIVGNVQEPDVWENHRHVIDIQITKKFFDQKMEIKLNIRDLLAQDLILYQDLNRNKRYDLKTDNRWQETSFGQTISLSLSYKL